MRVTARTVALQALLQMEENQGYSNIVIDKVLKASGLDKRDSGLASTIFYGVLEKKLSLDYLLRRCLADPGKKIDKIVLFALRCGAYQLKYLDRIPESAAVNETVNAVKDLGKASASGFVNGVLRNMIRQGESLCLPQGDTLRDMSVRYSIPEPLINMWEGAYGKECTLKMLEAFQEKSRIYLRINTLKTNMTELSESLKTEGVRLEEVACLPGAAIIENCGSPITLPQFESGLFHIQDLSAQLVCDIVNPQPGETICDCCAAPGGKTFTLYQRMEGAGKIIALDLYPGRVRLIRSGAKRLGLKNMESRVKDCSKVFENIPSVDRMLCDVPCSGYGVIRRKPEIRYKDISSAKQLPSLQYDILKNASGVVKRGGNLVYSTCTLNPAENREVVERFLNENPDFQPEVINLSGIKRTIDEPDYMLTMMPFSGASDGFFAASFRKK